jgi:hypothetical protein
MHGLLHRRVYFRQRDTGMRPRYFVNDCLRPFSLCFAYRDNMLADGACGFGVMSSGDEQSCPEACAAGQTASATVACTLGA